MKSIGNRIRNLRRISKVSQKELAEALGVGQTTIANYESDQRQPSIDKLILIAEFFDLGIDDFLERRKLESETKVEENKSYSEQHYNECGDAYLELLLKQEKKVAENKIIDLIKKGHSIFNVYSSVLVYSLHKLGKLWETGFINTAEEHMVSEVTQKLIAQMSYFSGNIESSSCKAVVVSAFGEKHTIAGKMLTDLLELEGIDVSYLGSDVPTRSLVESIEKYDPDVLFISVTMEEFVETTESMITAIRMKETLNPLKILVGGQAFEHRSDKWKHIGADDYASDFLSAIELVKKLAKIRYKELSHEKE